MIGYFMLNHYGPQPDPLRFLCSFESKILVPCILQ